MDLHETRTTDNYKARELWTPSIRQYELTERPTYFSHTDMLALHFGDKSQTCLFFYICF